MLSSEEKQSSTFTFINSTLVFDQIYSIRLVTNPLDHHYFEALFELAFILEEGLPNMKINQIHSYVFSSQNQKLLLLRRNQLIGGLSFKTIPKRYAEIQLMAVKKQNRSKGYGSTLISALKHLLQLRKISLLVTHADNLALQFYNKHGFSEQTYINNRIWSNTYEEFTNSTKVQCLIFPNINYFILRDKLKEQKIFFQDQAKSYYLLNQQSNRYQAVKETTNYRCFEIIFNKIYEKAESELKRIDQLILKSQVIEITHPFDLQCIYEKIKLQKYQSAKFFFHQLNQFLINATNLYKANKRVIFNLKELRQILESQKSILLEAMAQISKINVGMNK